MTDLTLYRYIIMFANSYFLCHDPGNDFLEKRLSDKMTLQETSVNHLKNRCITKLDTTLSLENPFICGQKVKGQGHEAQKNIVGVGHDTFVSAGFCIYLIYLCFSMFTYCVK